VVFDVKKKLLAAAFLVFFIASAQAFTLEKGTKLSTNTTQYNYTVEEDYSSVDALNITEQELEFSFSQETTLLTEDGSVFEACSSSCVISKPSKNEPIRFVQDSVGIINVTNTYSDSPVYETENKTYELDFNAHNIVNKVEIDLIWNGSVVNSKNVSTDSGTGSYTGDQQFEVPLVPSNNTQKNWSFDLDATYSDLDSSDSSKQISSSNSTQDVYWVLYNASTSTDQDKYIEKEDIDVSTSFTDDGFRGSKTCIFDYNRSTKTGGCSQTFNSGLEDSNKDSFNVTGTAKLSFNGLTRKVPENNKTVEVYRKILTDCSNSVKGVTGDNALEFNLKNEENQSQSLNGDLDYNFDVTHHGEHSRNYAFDKNNVSESKTCIYPDWAEYQVTGPIDYSSDKDQNSLNKVFPKRDFKLENNTLTNQTETLNLFLLEDGLATKTLFKVIDEANNPVQNVQIKTMRYFTGNNSFISVSSSRTDANGEAGTQLKPGTVYKHILTKNGKVLKSTSKSKLNCDTVPCTKTFQIGQQISPYFKEKAGFDYKLEKLKNSNGTVNGVQATVNHESGVIDGANFSVEKQATVGYTQVCEISTASAGQSMVCQFNETVEGNQFKYDLDASKSGTKYNLVSGVLEDLKGLFGKSNPWAATMIFLTLTGLGLRTPKTSIALSTAGAVIAWFIGLITVSTASISSLVIIAGIVLMTGEN
jgi:hypothetical protein